jgi:hypothetical protein
LLPNNLLDSRSLHQETSKTSSKDQKKPVAQQQQPALDFGWRTQTIDFIMFTECQTKSRTAAQPAATSEQ